MHAVGLFDANGEAVAVCEDIGRHNAMDKLVGRLLDRDALPANDHMVVVSGRASFELIQKALMAGIPIFVSIGAPSSLALTLAEEHGMTLVGFLKPHSFNVYHGAGRLTNDP
jgi:FdhD protein